MAVDTKSRKRSKSKSRKSKDSKASVKKKSEKESKDQDPSNIDEDGIKKKLTNTAMFRKVKLRNDDHLWWGLNAKYDDSWCGDLVLFQLPRLAEDPLSVSGSAFKKRTELKPYEIEGREETSAFAWGDGGEGRIGSGFGVTDRVIPTLVNRPIEAPLLVNHAFTSELKQTAERSQHITSDKGLVSPHHSPEGGHHGSAQKHAAGRIIDVAAGARHCLCVTEDGVIYAWGEGHAGQLGSRKVEKHNSSIEGALMLEGEETGEKEFDVGGATGFGMSAAKKALEKKKAMRQAVKKGGKLVATGKGLYELMNCTGAAAKSVRRIFLTKPCAVTPSGHLKRGKDVISQQVAAGAFTSYAREANPNDGERSVEGLRDTISQVQQLFDENPDFFSLAELRSYLHEERFRLDRAYVGRVMAWGSGRRGELGLGEHITERLRPTPLPFFNNKVVKEISAGKRHVLACDMEGFVYSWGCGADGRLGHNDFADRWEPCRVEALAHGVVTCFSAGDAHSVVNMAHFRRDPLLKPPLSPSTDHDVKGVSYGTTALDQMVVHQNKQQSDKQKRGSVALGYRSIHDLACLAFPVGVYAWGRGAHGRLGLGRNSNKKTPTMITDWPDSSNGYKIIKLACGGAHTLVLSEKTTQPSLANKWGSHRQVFAFGCGHSGQLGCQAVCDQYTPIRVKLPTHELFTGIAAGKSHSMALTINGDAYAWGKNWYGELGSGDRDLTPTPVLIGRNQAKPPSESKDEFGFSQLAKSRNTTAGGLGRSRSGDVQLASSVGGHMNGSRMNTAASNSGRGVVNLMQAKRRQVQEQAKAITEHVDGEEKITTENERKALDRLDSIDMDSGPVFLKLSGGDRHSLSLALKGRPAHLKREKIAARGVKGLRDEGELIYMGLPKQEAMILSRWECARRCPLAPHQSIHSILAKGAPRHLKAATMYACETCNLKALCRSCTMWCHVRHGHVIGPRPFNAPRQLCQCGLGPCGLLLCIVEHTPDWCHINAKIIQHQARAWLAVRKLDRLKKASYLQRHLVAKRVWAATVTQPVFSVVKEALRQRQITQEKLLMSLADEEGLASRKYLKLQKALVNIETQKLAIGQLTAATGVLDPHPSVRERWFDPNLFLTTDISPQIRKLRINTKSLIRTVKPPAKLGVVIPETDAEKEEKKKKAQDLKIIQEATLLDEETGEPLQKVKDRMLKKEDPPVDFVNGSGISFKPDERPLLGPISPYFRHLTRQSLREAQRHYREHERLRPCSKLEVFLTKDLPAWGRSLHRIYDPDVNQFIEIARSVGCFAYEPDVTLPLESSHLPPSRPQTSMQKTTATPSRSGTAATTLSKKRGKAVESKGVKNEQTEERNSERKKYRRSASIAAPELMYRRVCLLRPAMQRNLKVKRSNSFDETSRVTKGVSEEDIRLRMSLGGRSIRDGARKSANLMKRALMPKGLTLNPLAAKNILPKSKAGQALGKRKLYNKMLVPTIPLRSCLEVRPLLERVNDLRAKKAVGGLGDRPGDIFNAVEQERLEEHARRHLGRSRCFQSKLPPKRRHSLSAPERVNMMFGLWERHHALVASIRRNPLTKGENSLFAYPSGCRNDDDVSYRKLKQASKENTSTGYYDIDRLTKQNWEEEKRLIEEVALLHDFDLDYQSILDGSRPSTCLDNNSVESKQKSKPTDPSSRASTRASTTRASATRASTTRTATRELAKAVGFNLLKPKSSQDKAVVDQIGQGLDIVTKSSDDHGVEGGGDTIQEGAYAGGAKWTEAFTSDGTIYYYNNLGETVWELPDGASAHMEDSDGEWSQYDQDNEANWWDGSNEASNNWYGEDGEDYQGDWGEYNEEWGGEWGDDAASWDGYDETQWEELIDDQGFTYWYNETTGESQY